MDITKKRPASLALLGDGGEEIEVKREGPCDGVPSPGYAVAKGADLTTAGGIIVPGAANIRRLQIVATSGVVVVNGAVMAHPAKPGDYVSWRPGGERYDDAALDHEHFIINLHDAICTLRPKAPARGAPTVGEA